MQPANSCRFLDLLLVNFGIVTDTDGRCADMVCACLNHFMNMARTESASEKISSRPKTFRRLGKDMFGIGLPEMILIMAIALIVVGPDKLPDLARSVAKGVLELKKTVNTLKENFEQDNPFDTVKPELEEAAQSLKEQLGDPSPDGWTGLGEDSRDAHLSATDENMVAAGRAYRKDEPLNEAERQEESAGAPLPERIETAEDSSGAPVEPPEAPDESEPSAAADKPLPPNV